jgi:hypothetical protein
MRKPSFERDRVATPLLLAVKVLSRHGWVLPYFDDKFYSFVVGLG